MTINVVISMLL